MSSTPALIKRAIALSIIGLGIILLLFQGLSSLLGSVKTMIVPVSTPVAFVPESYDQLLKTYVKDGLVDYKSLKSSPLLKKSMDELARTSPAKMADKKEQLAYWINAYNLLTLKVIADRYPITTIEKLGNDKSSRKFSVGGEQLSVQDIYIQKLMPMIKATDAKYIFLLSGGSVGYPALLDRAVAPEKMERDMELAAYKWIMDARNARFDEVTQTLFVSPYLQWNSQIIETQYATPFDFVLKYMSPTVEVETSRPGTIKTFGQRFNWTLNDAALKKTEG